MTNERDQVIYFRLALNRLFEASARYRETNQAVIEKGQAQNTVMVNIGWPVPADAAHQAEWKLYLLADDAYNWAIKDHDQARATFYKARQELLDYAHTAHPDDMAEALAAFGPITEQPE